MYAFTDGSSKKTLTGMKGGVGIHFSGVPHPDISEGYTHYNNLPPTNQRMELLAIKRAIDVCIKHIDGNDLTIISDSMYAIKCITEWSIMWDEKGIWHQKSNTDIIKPLCDIMKRYRSNILFRHVRSHQKEPLKQTPEHLIWRGNRTADELATQGLVTLNGAV